MNDKPKWCQSSCKTNNLYKRKICLLTILFKTKKSRRCFKNKKKGNDGLYNKKNVNKKR